MLKCYFYISGVLSPSLCTFVWLQIKSFVRLRSSIHTELNTRPGDCDKVENYMCCSLGINRCKQQSAYLILILKNITAGCIGNYNYLKSVFSWLLFTYNVHVWLHTCNVCAKARVYSMLGENEQLLEILLLGHCVSVHW